jgi:hypothetical protein
MLGGPCGCCGCTPDTAYTLWKKLRASRLRLTISGEIPKSDDAATAAPYAISFYGKNTAGEGWFAQGTVQPFAVPSESPEVFARPINGYFLQGKEPETFGTYDLLVDLTERDYYNPGSYTAWYPYEFENYNPANPIPVGYVHYFHRTEVLTVLAVAKIRAVGGENVLTDSPCSCTVKVYVGTRRKFFVDGQIYLNGQPNLGRRAGITVATYDGVASGGLVGVPDFAIYDGNKTKWGVASIPAYQQIGPGGAWWTSLSLPEQVAWRTELESYTELDIDSASLPSLSSPVSFARRPEQWLENTDNSTDADGGPTFAASQSFSTKFGLLQIKNNTRASSVFQVAPLSWKQGAKVPQSIPSLLAATSGREVPQAAGLTQEAANFAYNTVSSISLQAQVPQSLGLNLDPSGGVTPVQAYVRPGTYMQGDKFTVEMTYPNAVTPVSGNPPKVWTKTGEFFIDADYVSGGGSSKLIYEAKIGDQITSQLVPTGSTPPYQLQDVTVWGYNASYDFTTGNQWGFWPQAGVIINPTTPAAAVTAGAPVPPASTRTLIRGEYVEFTLTYPGQISLTGQPFISSAFGNHSPMTLHEVGGDYLRFRYTVTASLTRRVNLRFDNRLTFGAGAGVLIGGARAMNRFPFQLEFLSGVLFADGRSAA